MATTRATGRETPIPVEDEFLHLLYRGGELLAAGKVIEAKDFLERAHKLQPKHEKGQNLLGLTYFKLGLFDRAAELYEMLVRDNPVDPTLRVNLGLVYLKTNALQRAVREFEVAVDLAPDHKKAHNYLGLALAQQGEYGRAREHFVQAGSDAMAEKMSRAIAGEGFSRPPPVQPAKERGFAELEGAEVVREQGGVPVTETPPPVGAEQHAEAHAGQPAELHAGQHAEQYAESHAGQYVESHAGQHDEPHAEQHAGPHAEQHDGEYAEPQIDVVEEAPAQQSAPEPSSPPPAPVAAEEPRRVPPPPPAEEDWGAQFGLDDAAQPPTEATALPSDATAESSAYAAAPDAHAVAPSGEPQLSGSEGPVMVVTAPVAPPSEDISITLDEVPSTDIVDIPTVSPASGDNLPVMEVEEVSEDGMPVLTAEPEDAEDLAAIAQHQDAPSEAQPPPPPVEASTEAVGMESSAAAAHEFTAPGQTVYAPEGTAPAGAAETSQDASSAMVPASPEHAASLGVAGSGAQQEGAAPILGELAVALALGSASPTSRFNVGPGGFSAVVEGELLTRLEGLVAFSGQLTFQPEMKRFRGRTTDKPFGDGGRRMVRASGRGMLFIEPAERQVFQAVDLGEESAYFRDECVFAFEEPVMFENGRVPSDVAPDLDLVHLRGNGKVLLSLAGPLRSVAVRMEVPVTVPLRHLVGWQGNLTPRVVSLLVGPGGEILKTGVELSGEGFALICLPVR